MPPKAPKKSSEPDEPNSNTSPPHPFPTPHLQPPQTWHAFTTSAQLILGTANPTEDSELFSALAELEHVPTPTPHIDTDQTDLMIRYIATVLDRAGPSRRANGFDARAATMALIDNLWDLEGVLENFTAEDELMAQNPPGIHISEEGDEVEETYYEMMNRMNPDIDRQPALQGGRDDRKLSVVLRRENNADLNARFKDADQMNWVNATMIQALNRWRNQYLRRHLGLIQNYRIPFHPEEIDWITILHQSVKEEAEEKGERPNFRFKWSEIERDFNHQFEGQMLGGEVEGRPRREKTALLRQRYRIRVVKEMLEEAGAREQGEDEDEEDEEEKGEGQRKGGESSKRGRK